MAASKKRLESSDTKVVASNKVQLKVVELKVVAPKVLVLKIVTPKMSAIENQWHEK